MTGFVTAEDGAQIVYKSWGEGRPVVFSHGWPLNADIWDEQLLFFAQNGFRAIAFDRRGHGRSSQTSERNDMNGYADDLAALMNALDLRDAFLVGHSTGGGEVARYVGRHGADRVAGLALVSAVTPAFNADGSLDEVVNGIRQGLTSDRSQFYADLSLPFFGGNRDGSSLSQGVRDQFWRLSMQAGLKGAYDCTFVWSEDHGPDLQAVKGPTLVIHGTDDQIVPIDRTARRVREFVPHAVVKEYAGAPHGVPVTHRDQFNADLLAFVRG